MSAKWRVVSPKRINRFGCNSTFKRSRKEKGRKFIQQMTAEMKWCILKTKITGRKSWLQSHKKFLLSKRTLAEARRNLKWSNKIPLRCKFKNLFLLRNWIHFNKMKTETNLTGYPNRAWNMRRRILTDMILLSIFNNILPEKIRSPNTNHKQFIKFCRPQNRVTIRTRLLSNKIDWFLNTISWYWICESFSFGTAYFT